MQGRQSCAASERKDRREARIRLMRRKGSKAQESVQIAPDPRWGRRPSRVAGLRWRIGTRVVSPARALTGRLRPRERYESSLAARSTIEAELDSMAILWVRLRSHSEAELKLQRAGRFIAAVSAYGNTSMGQPAM